VLSTKISIPIARDKPIATLSRPYSPFPETKLFHPQSAFTTQSLMSCLPRLDNTGFTGRRNNGSRRILTGFVFILQRRRFLQQRQIQSF